MPPRAALFLDRDGTIIEDPGYLSDPDKVVILPLDLYLDKRYSYRLEGEESLDGRKVWKLAFEPAEKDAALARRFLRLEHQHTGALPEDESVTAGLERTTRPFRLVVARRQRLHRGKARHREIQDRRFRASGQHDVRFAAHQQPRGFADRVRARRGSAGLFHCGRRAARGSRPMTDPAIEARVGALRHRRRGLRARPRKEIVDRLGQVLERWRDPGSSIRTELESSLPDITGFTRPTIHEGLERALAGWTSDALQALVAAELGDDAWGDVESLIELVPELPDEAFDGLEAFSHVEVIFHFDQVDAESVVQGARHPRGLLDPRLRELGGRATERPAGHRDLPRWAASAGSHRAS